MRLTAAIILMAASTCALSQQVYKCKNAQGRVELSDTGCAGPAERVAIPRDERPVSDGHRQDQIALDRIEATRRRQECDAARQTLQFTDNYGTRTAMRQACGIPEPTPARKIRIIR